MTNQAFLDFKRMAELTRLLAHWEVEVHRLRQTKPNSAELSSAIQSYNATLSLMKDLGNGKRL